MAQKPTPRPEYEPAARAAYEAYMIQMVGKILEGGWDGEDQSFKDAWNVGIQAARPLLPGQVVTE